MWETWVWTLGSEDPLEKGTATHSSILAWRIPWRDEPGRLQSTGSQRVEHDQETFTFTFHFRGFPGGSGVKASACSEGDLGSIPGWERSLGERNIYPLQYSYLENSMDRGAWWVTIHRVPKSQTWLINTFTLEGISQHVHSRHLGCLDISLW